MRPSILCRRQIDAAIDPILNEIPAPLDTVSVLYIDRCSFLEFWSRQVTPVPTFYISAWQALLKECPLGGALVDAM